MMHSRSELLSLAFGLLLAGLGASLLLLHREAARAHVDRRLDEIRRATGLPVEGPPLAEKTEAWIRFVTWIGAALAGSGLLSQSALADLRQTLNSAALTGRNGLALFIGAKALLSALLLVTGWLLVRVLGITSMLHLLLPALGCIIGLMAPDIAVRRLRKRYLAHVEAGVPDTLDMLVICSEAGLGLEASIERVAEELELAHPSVTRELQLTAHEFRMISDRREVFMNLGRRTGLDSLRRLGATLIQTAQFGTPLSHALRVLASEMRQESMTRYEGRAARLPVLLTMPMILFILPCVFIIVGGPAVLQMMHVLKKG